MIKIASPWIDEETEQDVIKVLRSGIWAQGPKVREFEEDFAEYIGTKHAIAVNSGTAALHLALLSCGIKRGDEVITTPFSFVASSNAILMCGAKPVFVDINPETFNINPDQIEKFITSKTKAILPVHIYGNPCKINKIKSICEENDLVLIEDACQAHGSEFNNQKVGSFSNAGCFSFYATKSMACGEGGMITTNDDGIAQKARILRQHGEIKRYHTKYLGYNYRMTDISAAIGLGQLKYVEEWTKKRNENAHILTEQLNAIKGISVPIVNSATKHNFHLYTLRVLREFKLSRDDLKDHLNKNNIEAMAFYPTPIHQQELYQTNENYPEAELASQQVLSLPVHQGLCKEDMLFISDCIKKC